MSWATRIPVRPAFQILDRNGGDEMSDFGEGKWVKCRKGHRCEWCGQQILASESAYYYSGIWDGDWQSWYMHEECEGMECHEDGFTPFENPRPEEACGS